MPGLKLELVLASVLALGLLGACGGGGGGGGSNGTASPAVDAPVYSALTTSRLLSDNELRAPAPPAGVSTPVSAELQWLQNHHHPVRSLVADADFSDLAFLRTELAGKRLVQLGESSHGAREFNLIKVRLIKFLHQQMGFDVLAFESSLVACHLLNQSLAGNSQSAVELTRQCAFAVWRTEELNELFRYVQATQATSRPLRIAGFDVQTSSNLDASAEVQQWMLSLARKVDTQAAVSVPDIVDRIVRGGVDVDSVAAPLRRLLEQGAAKASGTERASFETALLTLDMLKDRHLYYAQVAVNSSDQSTRERGMANLVTGLAQKVYPGQKIMLWAHNAHVATQVPYWNGVAPMGAYLKPTWGAQLYTLGLFMLRGENVSDIRTKLAVSVLDPKPGSLEELAYSLGLGAVFLPIERSNQSSAGDDWQHRSIGFRSWGTVDHFAPLSANYDGVLVIDRTTLPRYN